MRQTEGMRYQQFSAKVPHRLGLTFVDGLEAGFRGGFGRELTAGGEPHYFVFLFASGCYKRIDQLLADTSPPEINRIQLEAVTRP